MNQNLCPIQFQSHNTFKQMNHIQVLRLNGTYIPSQVGYQFLFLRARQACLKMIYKIQF
jgi:hypothetical protein